MVFARIRSTFKAESEDEVPKGRPPMFLKLRSSTPFIAFVVAVGGELSEAEAEGEDGKARRGSAASASGCGSSWLLQAQLVG